MSSRMLPADEWHRLEEPVRRLFGEDKTPPPPDSALCAVEENESGDIVGFLFFQVCAHLEPFGSLGGASISQLKTTIDAHIGPGVAYYMHTDNTVGMRKALDLGFQMKGFLLQGVS